MFAYALQQLSVFLRFTPFALCHPAASGAITMPATSWTKCQEQPELVSSSVDQYSVREPATQCNRWLEWMDDYAASGAIDEWKPNVVVLQRDDNGQPEVPMTAMTGKVKAPAIKVTNRQPSETRVGSIVRHFGMVQVDMFGRRGWMTEDSLEARLESHCFVLEPLLKWCTNKVNAKSPAESHECTNNFRFTTLDGQDIEMGDSRH